MSQGLRHEHQAALASEMDRVLAAIPSGRENAITMRRLVEATGLSQRIVYAAVEQLRNSNPPRDICSGSPGYWLATDEADFDETLRQMDSRIENQTRTRASVARALDRFRARRVRREPSGQGCFV